MLSRSHAAHAAPANWLDDARTALRVIARAASRTWRNALTRRERAVRDDRVPAGIGAAHAAALAGVDRFPWDSLPRWRQPRRDTGPSVWQRAGTMWQRHRSRRRIASLDAAMLKDIGVSFAEAEAEANKPFWRG
jgi:uncharacterized protein YjiS (DUF1127 family)